MHYLFLLSMFVVQFQRQNEKAFLPRLIDALRNRRSAIDLQPLNFT